ncbi:gliding motility-associated C-terminal domain-containing protein [Gilvibacter sp.]|uniref:gliding motility-associated C-terminal domain-containing protein n=1 Tax=Gilvibacter sp. TaxID=2729997 RepID=UPI0025BDD0D8|nr:gliding motility-associated C-terminal domain-containing protein [Gilvibacter sp.]NQX78412.1 gliding motility-associated C-terminal domain-containing protein [Gilvibacter sp.]
MRNFTPRFLQSIFALAFLFLGLQQSQAQLDAQLSLDDAFAKGNFIEIGINQNGTFGVPNDQNPGPPYHDSRETGNDLFGFIANPTMDGWVDYDGDFFTPGSPEEGWGIEYDGAVWNNNLASPNQVPGAISGAGILTDPCFGDFAQISWNGFIDGIEIIRNFSVSRDGLFIRMEQRLTNLDAVPKTNLYWMNNVDPDNNQTINGTFTTDQELIAQPSGGIDILGFVCASQGPLGGTDANGSSVCYYVQDERARVTYGGFSNRDPSDIWNGVGFEQTEGATNTADEAISIAYFFGDLAPGESVNFTYFYVFRDFTGGGVDPTFISLAPQSPSACGADDGSILVTGLLGDTDYNISYVDDGVPVGPITLPADMTGSLTIGGLDAGVYTDFVFTNDAGCFFENAGPIVVEDPGAPTFTAIVNQPVACDMDGSLELSGLTPATSYDLTYTQDGTVIGPATVLSDATGSIFITGLGEVTITDITLEQGTCSFTDPGPYTFEYPDFTPVVTTADPVNCDSDGSLTVDGLAADTTYEVTYLLDGVLVGPITVTTDATGQFIIAGLDEGVYTDITIVLNDCTYTAAGPFELNRPSLGGATIAGVDPTTCGPTGQVIISNVFPNTTFELTYTFNGVPVGPITVTSDASGTIVITGLLAGIYADGVLTFNDCSFTQPAPVELMEPDSPSFTVTAQDSDVCGPNGALLIEGLMADTTYNVTYTVDGVVVGPMSFTTDSSGNILITGLDQGIYTDVTVEIVECSTTLAGPFEINYPDDPTFTVTVNDPTTCSADGSIVISGLSAGTTYDVSYNFNGTPVGPDALTADGAGTIVISGLDEGVYTDILVDLGACQASDAGPYEIMYPDSPAISDPAAYELCGTPGGVAEFDLTSRDNEITGGASGLTVTYHETLADAESGDNPLTSPYSNTSNPQTIYVRVVDDVTGCVSTTALELVALVIDSLSAPAAVESCPADGASGLTNQFDLTAFNSEFGVDLSGLTVTYHTNSADAEDGSNPIANPESYTNVTTPETIYIRVANAAGCFQTTSVEISVVACEIEIPQGISPNNDGFNDTFDIGGLELHPNFELKIFDRRGLLVYSGNGSTQDWDGRAIEKNGELLPVGTYFYTLQLNDMPGDPFSDVEQLYSGWVYLNY